MNMALIKCPECGKEISDKAQCCPNCGCPNSEFGNLQVEVCNEKNIDDEFDKNKEIISNIINMYSNPREEKIKVITQIRSVLKTDLLTAKTLAEKYILFMEEESKIKESYWCRNCYRQNEIGSETCAYCGSMLMTYNTRYNLGISDKSQNTVNKAEKNPKHEFTGVYRSTLFGKLQEVCCPRCGSENCSHYQEQKIVPGKTKTRYTANLNPLKPFTLLNKKEKVVKKEQVVTESKFICNSCGKIFY